jgi:hypothetical protein
VTWLGRHTCRVGTDAPTRTPIAHPRACACLLRPGRRYPRSVGWFDFRARLRSTCR